MYTIEYLKKLSNYTVQTWIHNHMYDTDDVLGTLAAHHEIINGQLTFRMISYDEFFQMIESDINSDDITFDFIGCGIKGPFNLYMSIKNYLSVDYINNFPTELKYNIIEHVSHHEYLKNIYNTFNGELPETKIILGLYYLSYILDNKNEIYDIILEYKMKVIHQNFDM